MLPFFFAVMKMTPEINVVREQFLSVGNNTDLDNKKRRQIDFEENFFFAEHFVLDTMSVLSYKLEICRQQDNFNMSHEMLFSLKVNN